MAQVSRCLHCGKRLVAKPTFDVQKEFQCIWCDKVDPMKTDLAKWADSPLARTASNSPTASHQPATCILSLASSR
jgi:hypothetical protein